MKNDSHLRRLFDEKGWPSGLLEDLGYLHSLDRASYPLSFQDPYTMLPLDPGEWYGILLNYDLLAFGNCPNGDFIALDCAGDAGSVVYVSHEEFHYDPASTEDIGDITRRVAGSIRELVAGLEEGTAPLDCHE